jgi:tRNA-dihydrouridine synthase
MTSFWNSLPKPFFVLAPMEAVTDVVFRHVINKAAAPDVWFTEFTNATGWAHAGDKAIGGRLIKTDDESPIVAQLWGSDPEAMTKLALHCADLGYHGIDINMGCPDSSAVKSGGGAGMIRTPELAYEMIAAAKVAGLPVSVKTRLGYSFVDEWHDWLKGILEQDVAVLTIHLRTKKEMSKVPAHFELIPAIKQLRDEIAPDTLLVINGDVKDRAHGLEFVESHGVDGVMIGRGIFANPFAFEATTDTPRSKQELLDLLRYHLNLYDTYSELTRRPFETLKLFFKIYILDFDGASELRDRLMHSKSTDEARSVLDTVILDS